MFCIDVIFEMRTAAESKAFIQLIIKHNPNVFYSRNRKRGKGQDSGETERERARERV
jgi:hypothetical protein